MTVLLLLAAILPGLLIGFFIFRIDKYEREKLLPLAVCFALGTAITYPALHLQIYLDGLGFSEEGTLWQTLVFALVGVALSEELFKSACVFVYPFHQKFFNEPMDGIVYTVFVGMGFATAENVLYAFEFDLTTVLVRSFTAVPAHAVFGVLAGYYFGLAKFAAGGKLLLILQGILCAVLLHGLYDFFILQQVYEELTGLALLCLAVGIRISRRLVRLHLAVSPFRDDTPVV